MVKFIRVSKLVRLFDGWTADVQLGRFGPGLSPRPPRSPQHFTFQFSTQIGCVHTAVRKLSRSSRRLIEM